MSITIFSASIGNGHNEASHALKEQFELQGETVDVVDTFQCIHPLLHKLFLDSYLHILKRTPNLWGKMYKYGADYSWFLLMDYLGACFCEKLQTILTEQRTTIMVSTHPFVTAFLSKLKTKKNLQLPLYTIITDLGLHPAYFRSEVNGYFTASPYFSEFAEEYNIPSEQFFCTGIPIKQVPDVSLPRRSLRVKLALKPEKKTLLITGGGLGIGKFVEIVQSLEEIDEEIQILCLTGRNEGMEKKLRKMCSKHTLHIIPFTKQFTEYLRASDVILSKAGGLTMSEALACETPILIYQPVPGHEEENAQFLIETGTAVKAETLPHVNRLLYQLFNDEHYYNYFIHNAKKIKKPNAARRIAELIKDLEATTEQSYDPQSLA
ncbi:MGDG synthase family glycosyltransferase [Bacillus suaedae]|uniref:Glycosyltransferase n=1 Tax=Halalkalibacter suaedae TaxID=2822140 RepID=A0A941ASN2_9BACI|nr:glycosyltransferase [Bacillus suaedae]MBP3949529.1 glycosyltransferase [Bacillus suaedae]